MGGKRVPASRRTREELDELLAGSTEADVRADHLAHRPADRPRHTASRCRYSAVATAGAEALPVVAVEPRAFR